MLAWHLTIRKKMHTNFQKHYLAPIAGVLLASTGVIAGSFHSPAQAYEFNLTAVTIGPDKWEYEVLLSELEFLGFADGLTISFGTNVTSVSNPTSPGNLVWGNSGPGTAVTWTVKSGMTNPLKETTVGRFDVVCTGCIDGPVTWGTNVLGGNISYKGETRGPVAQVPGPLPALGLAAAFGFSRKLRKRIKLHKGTSAVSTSPVA